MRSGKREAENHQRLRLKQVASPEVWTENMLDALVNGVQGGKWYSLYDKVWKRKTLQLAWQRVKANKGAAGIDRQSIERFEANEDLYLQELQEQLQEEAFQPQPIKRVYIPKGKGKVRPLGILTVKDRIVQMAVLLVIQPIYDNEFTATSFGFRPELGCKDALREVDRLRRKNSWVVDIDLKSYFDTIPHGMLLEQLKRKITDGKLMGLIEAFLKAEIMEGTKGWTPTRGTPQGAILSPLLANIYLDPLDKLLLENQFKPVRYADDLVIMCTSREEAERALTLTENWAKENGLELNREKSHIGNAYKGKGFEFLGYRFEEGKKLIRKKSLTALIDKIREKTKRTAGKSVTEVVKSLNPMLRGWFEYFKHAQKGYFRRIDQFTRRRLRAMLRCQKKWSRGQGHSYRDHKEWSNAFFANLGLFTMKEAREAALQSR